MFYEPPHPNREKADEAPARLAKKAWYYWPLAILVCLSLSLIGAFAGFFIGLLSHRTQGHSDMGGLVKGIVGFLCCGIGALLMSLIGAWKLANRPEPPAP